MALLALILFGSICFAAGLHAGWAMCSEAKEPKMVNGMVRLTRHGRQVDVPITPALLEAAAELFDIVDGVEK